MTKTKYIAGGALFGICLVCIASWLAGFSFDSRGPAAFWTLFFALGAGLVGARIGYDIHDGN